MAAQVATDRGLRVVGVASESKRELVGSTGATFVLSGADFADRVRAVVPDGVDLVLDLVGGDVLRAAAPLASSPERVVSAADGAVVELGGAMRRSTPEALREILELVRRRAVDPHVSVTYPLERAGEAVAAVESGHAAGKVVVEVAP